jgi:shikimate kinase
MNNIILIGFKSCGKSMIGRALAQDLGMPFTDTDALLEALHRQATHEILTFREIYRQYGQDYFRGLERQVVLEQLPQLTNHIIATGGGTFINHPPPEAVRHEAVIVYLEVDPKVLLRRIQRDGQPAFFTGTDLQADFAHHFQERHPVYQALADYTVNVSHGDPARAVMQIKEALNTTE